ncbi:MAG: hypothetical protein AAFX51_17610 [Cyanobacteria bacterium J06636_28]
MGRGPSLAWYADVQKEIVRYPRADGVMLTATLYLPPVYILMVSVDLLLG